MVVVEGLHATAVELMEAFRASEWSGVSGTEYVAFVGPEGGYQLIADYDGSLASLVWSRGATAAWRLSREGNRLVVEGRSTANECSVEAPAPRRQADHLLAQAALYRIQ